MAFIAFCRGSAAWTRAVKTYSGLFCSSETPDLSLIPQATYSRCANQAECVQHAVMSRLRATSTLFR